MSVSYTHLDVYKRQVADVDHVTSVEDTRQKRVVLRNTMKRMRCTLRNNTVR